MCGICGALGAPQITEHVRNLVPLMVRRGPDDKGYWSDGTTCAFGFRRLSIQDLTPTGHQPMVSSDERYVLVFNGEVYNFKALRLELERHGFTFRSSGDSEVVLYSLVCWGKDALARFNGMFALAFYDRLQRKLLLARDHAGIKPLYFMRVAKGIVFASQYDQILAHPASRDLAVSDDALGLYLRLGYIPAPYGMLRNTHMLEPGSWFEASADGSFNEGKFFTFPVYREPDLKGEEAYEAVDAAITESVKNHLVSDVPVGTFLSGGIDSPLVAAKIRALGATDVKAFTIGTNGDRWDESPDAIAYANEIGIPHLVEHIAPKQSLALLDDVVAACGEPFADFSIFPTMLVSRIARRDVKVMLSGDGGDELFWGYSRRFAPVIDKSYDFGKPLWLRTLRWGAKKYFGIGKGYPQLTWPTIGDWYQSKQTLLHEEFLKRVFPDCPPWPVDFTLFEYGAFDQDHTAQWTRWNEFVGRMKMILLKVDRASMHESLEVRVPLLDRNVLDVASRVDWHSCLDIGKRVGKIPLRKALARHVKHQTQAKRGFTVPMDQWLRGPLREVFLDTALQRKDFAGLKLMRQALTAEFDSFLKGSGAAWGLWVLLSLGLWETSHFSR